MIDKIKIKRRKPSEKRISISMRITQAQSKFMREKNYSPTGIFNEALVELGFKENQEE